ncbi:MAG: DNA N-6-adenine-methyltransferase [Kofleriaceae bacterium]
MRPIDIPAIVVSVDVQQIARSIIKEHIALQDCDRQLEAAERKTDGLRQEQARRRVEIGRLLVEAKKGIKRGGWEPYLEKLGISSQRASEWMRLAGFVDSQSPSLLDGGELPDAPTLADAGIDKRPRLHAEEKHAGVLCGKPISQGVSLDPEYQSDEWYTPIAIIDLAREVMGAIDLDPATCDFAQRKIQAATFYTKDDDGLSKEWNGRVWLNPPYSNPGATKFVEKLIAEYRAGRVTEAIMIQNSNTDTRWFHELASISTNCFVRGRIQFDREDGRGTQNRYAQVIFYLGPNEARFREVFSRIGLVGQLRAAKAKD